MKTILIVSIVILFSVGTLSAGEITITNPNNQSMWLIGSKQKITWKVQGDTPNLTITLWRGNIKMGVIADGIEVGPTRAITYTMTHSWKVGDLLGGKALPGNNYRIGIQAQGSRHCYKSASYFEIREMKPFTKGFPKTKFWDFSIDHLTFKAHRPSGALIWSENNPQNDIIYVDGSAIPSDITHTCWVRIETSIKMKTPPKSQITKADVGKWGLGAFGGPHTKCSVSVNIRNSGPELYGGSGVFFISTPKFTWEDVQTWPEEGKTFVKKLNNALTWSPDEAYVSHSLGKKKFYVEVFIDTEHQISETNESNNNNPLWPCIVFTTHEKGPWLKLIPYPGTALIDSTMEIEWRARDVGKRMEIVLWQSDQSNTNLIGVIADNILPPPPGPYVAKMSHTWKVGHLQGRRKAVEPGRMYWIMIRTMGTHNVDLVQTNEHYLLKMNTIKKPITIPDPD